MGEKAVVLLSGGIDSATTAAVAKSEGFQIHALSFDYGQRHRVELDAAQRVAGRIGATGHLVLSFDMREIGGSALTADIDVPRSSPDSGAMPRAIPRAVPVTYVPARNTIFLSFALSWAEVLGAPHLFIGANAVDYSGYPDCRPEYLEAYERMANLATKISVEGTLRFKIHAPLLFMTKAEIIRKGISLGFDYGLTWSCYDPQVSEGGTHPAPYRPCGECDSCLFRAKGFAEAGLDDPLLSATPRVT